MGHGHDEHGHGEHGHGHGHGNDDGRDGLRARLRHLFAPHSHDAGERVDTALETSRLGLRTVWLSFAALMVTALLQAAVVAVSGSVALLGDTLHNLADALTAVPLAIAFTIGRRLPTRRYTYGFGRTEDLAGVVVVLLIATSAVAAAWEAVRRLVEPRPVEQVGLVALAGLIGFLGNELVARYRIRVGRQIGSAALVADGLHARTDGFTSLAVLLGAGGVALGFEAADPLVGLVISVAIVLVLRDAAREVYRRLMDAVDPELVDLTETTLRATPGVVDVSDVRLRWIGHVLRAEACLAVDPDLTVVAAHGIAHDAEHRLLHEVPRLFGATIHTEPFTADDDPAHRAVQHHRPARPGDRGGSEPAGAQRLEGGHVHP